MIESFVSAANLPPVDPAEAAGVGHAEGRTALALLRQLGEKDWRRPTECTEWDVRALVSHLVGQCEDGIRLSTLLRREIQARRRHRKNLAAAGSKVCWSWRRLYSSLSTCAPSERKRSTSDA